MIGIDVGSEKVKWFDGKKFGFGYPQEKKSFVGISSKSLYVKKASYPICKGSQLKKLIVNDVISELDVDEEKISVSFCMTEKKEKECEFFVFVVKKEEIENFENVSYLTLDVVGAIASSLILYKEEEELTIVDAGSKKFSITCIKNGKLENLEIVRLGFKFLSKNSSFLEERLVPLLKGKVILIGGGALDEEFLKIFKKFCSSFEVPFFEPFGEKTPLFFNAYGLYHLKKLKSLSCKPSFKESSIFSSEVWRKHKTTIVASAVLFFLSGILFTFSLALELLTKKRDYLTVLKEYKKNVGQLIGEKVLAPKLQISQKYSKVKELEKFFLLDKPSLLVPIEKLEESIDGSVKILDIEGSLDSETFSILGVSKDEKDIKELKEKFSIYFKKVNVDKVKRVEGGVQFTISLFGVKR